MLQHSYFNHSTLVTMSDEELGDRLAECHIQDLPMSHVIMSFKCMFL